MAGVRIIRVAVEGGGSAYIETDAEHPVIAVYQDNEPVMGLLSEYADEGEPKQHLVVGHWPDGEEWVGLAPSKFESQEWADAEREKGAEGARDLLQAARKAHRIVHGTDRLTVQEFGGLVHEEHTGGFWIVSASDPYKNGFDDEVGVIYKALRAEEASAHGHRS